MSVGAVNKQTGERIPTAGMTAVDAVLSGTSTNPVQNKVVKEELDEKADTDMVAADFDATASYTAGNYCIYEGKFYKFKNNHSGAWSAADVDEIKIAGELASLRSGLTDLSEEVNGDATTYPYADVITIDDAVPANLADCSVKIEPVQDLHGQSAPYVGGAGKNKLPMTVDGIKAANTSGTWSGNSYAINNITIDVLTDADGNVTGIKLNGTPNANTLFYLYKGNPQNFTGMILNGSTLNSNDVFIGVSQDASPWTSYKDTGSGVTIGEFTSTNGNVDIMIYANNATNATFYPMIRLSTETDVTFAPYTNICPISGHTEASVQRDGVNQFDPDHYETFDLTGEGVNLRYGHQYDTGTYTIINNGSNMWYYRVPTKDMSDRGTTQNVSAGSSVTVTVDSSHILWVFCQNWVTDSPDNICVRIGSTTTYEPYSGKTYTIALGDTIYGGDVDFDSGVMTVDHVSADLGSIDYTAIAVADGTLFYSAYNPFDNMKNTATVGEVANALCEIAPIDTQAAINAGQVEGLSIGPDTCRIRIFSKSAYKNMSTTEFKSAMNGVQLLYELATPTTIQLTPQQIQLLKGTNTLYASTGDISVTVNGVSGAIGAVQEQVNDHEERIEDVESGLTTIVKTVTETITANNSGWLIFPAGRTILSATIGDYDTAILSYADGFGYISRFHLYQSTLTPQFEMYEAGTAYSVRYSYI